MSNELKQLRKNLKSFAKKCKNFKYTDSALLTFLLCGTVMSNNFLTAETKEPSVENYRYEFLKSINKMQENVKKSKKENKRLLNSSNLELIQLMEQGDHVVKSPWINWQFANGGYYNDWHEAYKGIGDKNEKYPYEGIFERSLNLYERTISPNSDNYELLERTRRLASATGLANGYGLISVYSATEPLVSFEISAGIRPRRVNKSPLSIADKTAIIPILPEPIRFTPPKPVIKLPVLPDLPAPPTFNIQLGSYQNPMGYITLPGINGSFYNNPAIGTPRTYTQANTSINDITTNNPSLRYGWASQAGGKSALFFIHFDVISNDTNGSTVQLNNNLTVTSKNPLNTSQRQDEINAGRNYNGQDFLVGGSRAATVDNVIDVDLENNSTINLIGPLVVGFEAQTDTYLKQTRNFDQKERKITNGNGGVITDALEPSDSELQSLIPLNTERSLIPGMFANRPASIEIKNKNGYVGHKVGLILTYENRDEYPNSNYFLTNNGIIRFFGEKSIGMQVFALSSPSRVTMSNTGSGTKGMFMGGIESYAMKWSSRVANNSTMNNSGTIEISGDAGTHTSAGVTTVLNSLSSGMAVIENGITEGKAAFSIRGYNGKVTNSGTINVSGGKGNTGMVLIVNAADDITNASKGTINVSSVAGRQNIAMRVDKGTVTTDAPGTPKAINDGNIYLDGDSSMGIVGTNADVKNNNGKKIATKTNLTIINGVGMATRGGNLENEGEIDLEGTGVSTNIGVYMTKGTNNPTGTFSKTSVIKVKGDDSTGALISNGTLNYGGNITAVGDGVSGLIIGDNKSNTADATVKANGTITVNNGLQSAGIYTYTDSSSGKSVTVKKGSYGIVVGKNSKLVSDGKNNVDVNVSVKGTESIGLYAGENAKLEVKDHTVNADDGAVNYDADKNSTLTLKGTGTARTGKKSLLFYLGENGTGKISLGGTMNATIEGGTTPVERGNAFYYVGNGTTFGTSEIENWAKNNFGDGNTSTLGNLNLTMNTGSRLFIAQNVGMNLSDTTGDTISSATGANITGTDYKTFMLYLSKLTINQNVDLDDTSDAYNHLEISNSSIKNKTAKVMAGTNDNQVAMAQENNKDLYLRNKVTLENEGEINLSGTRSTGIYAKFGELYNKASGVITVANKSTAMYGVGDSLLENIGKISIGTNSIGMYSEGSTTQAMKNSGIIQLSQTDSVAMSYKPDSSLAAGTIVENVGKIELTGDRNTGIYASGTSAYKARNSGIITLSDSAVINNPNVGLYTNNKAATLENTGVLNIGKNSIGIYGYEAKNSGKLNVGNAGIGIYSQNGDISLTNGKITTGTDEAVGVYTVGTSQNITNMATSFEIGDNSFGFVNVGTGNKITSNIANVGLGNKNVYVYSNDTAGLILNNTNITSTGEENYGIYSAGTVINNGNINLSSGKGSVAIYSIRGGTATNTGIINVGASDVVNKLYSVGMGAGYGTTDTGNVVNRGTINVNGKSGIGLYASGSGSTATNTAIINLNENNTTGIYVTDGAAAVNSGTITTGPGTYRNVVGVYLGEGSTLNNTGTININARNGKGVYLKGGTVINYGNITVNGETDINRTVVPFTTPDTGKELGGLIVTAPSGALSATITVNGVPQIPVVINTEARNPISVSASSIGMYVNTSGISFTNVINGLENLTSEADLIIGTEAAEITNSKYILINDPRILDTYRNAMENNPNIKWTVYSSSLTWMATPTLELGTNRITSLYLAKVPYTAWAGRESTPVKSTDTYNFADGLEQRYGVNALGSREREIFTKLNSIGNNEEILLYQAFDEMMGHQYGNLQQRINSTGNTLNKEFEHLQKDWRNPSKQNSKIKIFGMRNEYNSDTAGIINYTSNAYGVAYVHENETLKLGNSVGWYAGAVTNKFKFKDIGHSKEKQTMVKAGIFKTISPSSDYNGVLKWRISGDIFTGINEMNRKYLVVDDVFEASSNYNSYGMAIKNELEYDIRMSEKIHLRPYGSIKMEYGRFNSIKERSGQMKLEVKGNDYISVKPEIGAEFKYIQPLAVRTNLSIGLTASYENELGKTKNNKGRVRGTQADWFGIRGEKEDRDGNGKFDLKVGIDNTKFGITLNAGYDIKGKNTKGGIGFRAIY
ncbi:autotransporter-associated N-terminal domain-containing protein [Leptotrichia sp. HSP-342]|uniref:Autotransporter-associated N-terminal domain-containing protein n=1 Tax=Leptotrichia mesophila TaxID=3239303 RepID=A0AB39V912_9FUSO